MFNQRFINGKTRPHRTYRAILLSYLAMLTIFIVTGTMLMRQSETALTKEMLHANMASMNRMKNQLDDGLKNIEELCMEQSLNTEVTDFVYSQRRNDTVSEMKRHVAIVDIVKNMRSATIANGFVDTLYLMTLQDGDMLTNRGKYTLEEYFAAYYSGQDEMSPGDFLALNAETGYKRYVAIPAPLPAGTNAPAAGPATAYRARDLLFLYALPLGVKTKTAVMGVRISNTEILGLIKDSEWLPGAHVALLDDGNNIIELSGAGASPVTKAAPWDKVANEEPFLWSYNGERYFMLAVDSAVSPWRYGLIVPSNVYMQPWTSHMQAYVLGLALMLIVGATMAIFMANIQYRPIRRLVNIAASKDIERRASGNEFADIERAFSDMMTENDELSRLNRLQREMLRKQQLTAILNGSISDDFEIGGVLRGSGMPMRYARYALVLVSGAQADHKAADDVAGSAALLAEALPAGVDAIRIDAGQAQCLLLNLPDSLGEAELTDCCAARAGESDAFGRCRVSMSGPYEGAEGIHPAYLEAQEVCEYQLAQGGAQVMSVGQLPEEPVEAQADEAQAPGGKADKEVLATEAVALIQQRYTDPMLSVASIADELGISQVALSRVFKRFLNIGVLDFIHRTRLKIAKQLISDTEANLLDIARQVGYTNNVTFIRVFKKYEGVTPSQYRYSHGMD